ncbi:hypothetical protein ACI2K6_05555 [Microbacterium sp. NPDC006705]|uniref:hypothetical protein n=1 Tax=Microbacterium TaxID=33882 RepID=UPI00249E01EA|nr:MULTISPECIES: hypothetical protein [Microbacterium]WHE36885.1 hypothetical protein P6897_03920 [Microbacterium sp. BDGP8]WRK18129.1 hypothetical protein VC184_03670 [Microbacterium plantarum]
MTDTTEVHPAASPQPKPRNRAARTMQIVIASLGIGALLMTVAAGVVLWPRTPETGPTADVPVGWAPWADNDLATPTSATFAEMNAAMRDKDRERFLAHATGDAATQLALWWDNSSKIGWDVAAIAPSDFDVDETGTIEVILGAQYAFAAQPQRGDGDRDAGLDLIQGFAYTVTFEPGTVPSRSFDRYEQTEPPEPATITSIVPAREPNPWDEGEIYVTKRDHVVLFGMSDEAELVDQNADAAERSAVIALDTIRALGGEPTQDGFVSAITDDDDRFQRWQYGKGTPWDMDVAGYARPTLRPQIAQRFLDPVIATGSDTSGTLIVMGPGSASGREQVFVHEFAHGLHYAAAPGSFIAPPVAVHEGFARFVEWKSGLADPGYLRPEVKAAVAAQGMGAFTDEALRSKDANLAYDAAGSFYAYADAYDGSAWTMAVDSVLGGGFFVDSTEFTEADWQAWVASQ